MIFRNENPTLAVEKNPDPAVSWLAKSIRQLFSSLRRTHVVCVEIQSVIGPISSLDLRLRWKVIAMLLTICRLQSYF